MAATLVPRNVTRPWYVPPRTIGMPNISGAVVSVGGLVFVGAATDNDLRALAIEIGSEVWKAGCRQAGRLPR